MRAVWTAHPATGVGLYVALVNLSDQPATVNYKRPEIRLTGSRYTLRDLWGREEIPAVGSLNVTLGPQAPAVYHVVVRFHEKAGLCQAIRSEAYLVLVLKGPRLIAPLPFALFESLNGLRASMGSANLTGAAI